MDDLQIPLSLITEDGLDIDVSATAEELGGAGAEGFPVDRVGVHGTITDLGGEYLFRGTVDGKFTGLCDRCLETAEAPFDIEVAWTFYEGSIPTGVAELAGEDEDGEEDDDWSGARPFEGGVIDLVPSVWEEVVLAAPTKYLCKEDCAGLCPRCGQNLNESACTCKEDSSSDMDNKGLAGLADMFPDLNPRDSED